MVLKRLHDHELTRCNMIRALCRFGQLQLASRILGDKGLFNGGYYYGLMEFLDMAFLRHYLWEDDLFVDIGANVGVCSILASGVAKARTIAFEPVKTTVKDCVDNVTIN